MEEKRVCKDSVVVVKVYLGTKCMAREGGHRRFYLEYTHFRNTTYILTDDPLLYKRDDSSFIHPDSWTGRALIGATVGKEMEVNIGGLSFDAVRVDQTDGNHIKYKVLSIG